MENFKVCRKCGLEKPTSEFYKYKTGKDGLRAQCKDCIKEYASSHPEQRRKNSRNFYHNNKERLLEMAKIYRSNHKESEKDRHHKWYVENKERINEDKSRRYRLKHNCQYTRGKYQGLERRTRGTIYEQSWRVTRQAMSNAQGNELNELKKEMSRISGRLYSHSPRGRVVKATASQRRRAKMKNALVCMDSSAWLDCINYFKDKEGYIRCAYCNKILENATQDHFIAMSKGGEYTKNNIVPACKSCNSSKNDLDFFEWYPIQKFYSKQREYKILKYLNYDPKTKYQQLALSI
jgi:hypothetical protein